MRRVRPFEAVAAALIHNIHRNTGRRQNFIPAQSDWRISMISGTDEATIDDIVASCDGDIYGALKALLLVNEQLEAELQKLHAAADHGTSERGSNSLH
jgi:hypothetical protein